MNSKVIAFLRKYLLIIPVVIGLMAFLVLYIYVRASMKAGSTPIHRIELEANLEDKEPPDKILLYEEQNREAQRERYIRQKEMTEDQLIALDFSRQYLLKKNQVAEHKEKETDTMSIEKHQPKKKSVKKRVGTKLKEEPSNENPSALNATSSFNTIKAEVIEKNDFPKDGPQFIQAVIDGDQRIKGNTILKMRLTESAVINGETFQPGTRFNGRASIRNQKITVNISRIQSSTVNMRVFDNDFSEGIVLNNEKFSLDRSLEESTVEGLDDVLREIPYGGIARFGKHILNNQSGRNKEVRLNDGYPVFISQQ